MEFELLINMSMVPGSSGTLRAWFMSKVLFRQRSHFWVFCSRTRKSNFMIPPRTPDPKIPNNLKLYREPCKFQTIESFQWSSFMSFGPASSPAGSRFQFSNRLRAHYPGGRGTQLETNNWVLWPPGSCSGNLSEKPEPAELAWANMATEEKFGSLLWMLSDNFESFHIYF